MASIGATSLLLTDLYQLTMLQAYTRAGLGERAVFEFYVRRLPDRRRFLIAAGLEQALDFLQAARFGEDELAWLQAGKRLDEHAIDTLRSWRFSGDVDAVSEGTVVFADEPLLRVTAPIGEAQIVETRLLNLLHFQTLIASKAARYRLAAGGARLLDFGLRRAHGAEAGLLAARAAYLAGFDGTATVLAGQFFDVPITGTMAHSFVMVHTSELDAFRNFARACSRNVVLLVDTYDTLDCVRRLPALIGELSAEGIEVRGIRLDSGDLGELARAARAILDQGGGEAVQIFASGGLDEDAISRLFEEGAPIDGFGVGTDLTTSADCPALDCAYKLVAYGDRPTRKRSPGKANWPGAKQVLRSYDTKGRIARDRLALVDDVGDEEGLLVPVMRGGERVGAPEPLTACRSRAATGLASLPGHLRDLTPGPSLTVEIDPHLAALAAELDRRAVDA